ncbi:MAG TPA: ShlB/FhaC/HecB family hemolysin secretion/activation protein [Rhizomicrobium sp.]|nr:ShlB/FhaC/HecB family hemolysin secretion/activation protein [Rhizomicrobium sp.]
MNYALLQAAAALALAVAQPAFADPPQASPPPQQERHIDIEAYDVAGNTLLDTETIETAVYPFLGPQRTIEDVNAARDALEHAYQSRGYQSVVVEIPKQDGRDGVVQFHVVEAPVGRLRVVGAKYSLPSEIREQVSALQEGKVPDFNTAQQQITEANRLPDRRVIPTLKPGVVPGTVDVDLKVNDTLPLHASAELNNDHGPDTRQLRATATVRYDDLFQLGQSFSFTYLRAPEDVHSGEVFSGSYLAPIWNTPLSILTYAYSSNSNVATLGGADVLGKGYAIGLRGILQLPNIDDVSESLSFGLDYKHFQEMLLFDGVTISAPIDYVPATVTYSAQLSTPSSTANVSASLITGLRGIGSNFAEFENKRANAGANFIHFNLDMDYTQSIAYDIQGNARLSWQVADQALVSSEQFAAGGMTSVRGYLQSEVVGDDGAFASVELRSPSFRLMLTPLIDDWRFFGFFDAADLYVIEPLADQQGEFDLYSTGVGSRIHLLRYLSGLVDVAFPLRSGPNTKAWKPVVNFSVKTEF